MPTVFVKIAEMKEVLDFSFLSPEETKLYQAFVPQHRKQQFVWGRKLLRNLLQEVFPEKEISSFFLKPSSSEKPKLFYKEKEFTECSVNISHSKSWVMAGLSRECHIGVDIEEGREHARLEAWLDYLCSPKEKKNFEQKLQNDPNRLNEELTWLWTAKEATLKCVGEGLKESLQAIDVDFERESVQFLDQKFHVKTLEGKAWMASVVCDQAFKLSFKKL